MIYFVYTLVVDIKHVGLSNALTFKHSFTYFQVIVVIFTLFVFYYLHQANDTIETKVMKCTLLRALKTLI